MRLLQLLPGPDDDGAGVRPALRRPAAQAGVAAHAARDGPRGLDSGGHRGDRCCAWRGTCTARPARRTSASRAAWRSTASATAGCCARGRSSDIWIQPAAGDAGGALGAALCRLAPVCSGTSAAAARREPATRMKGSLPRARSSPTTRSKRSSTRRRRVIPALSRRREPAATRGRELLADGKVVGWFQGRMEFGPRALGARSILGDPRIAEMQSVDEPQDQVPRSRSAVRAVRSCASTSREYFELDGDTPVHAARRARARGASRRAMTDGAAEASVGIEKLNVPRSTIPAVTHVDYSARVQTVQREDNPRYHALLTRVRAADRLPGARQHSLQRARRADRLHARRCLSLLHAHGDGLPRAGEPRASEVGAGRERLRGGHFVAGGVPA